MLRKVRAGDLFPLSNNAHHVSRKLHSNHQSINGVSMFRKESSELPNHQAYDQYKKRYELSNLIEDKKWNFAEFMKWQDKDLITEDEANELILDIKKEVANQSNEDEIAVKPRF